MSTSTELSVDLPDTEAAVRRTFDSERRKLHAWAARTVKGIEDRRDGELRRLDRAEAALAGAGRDATKAKIRTSKRSRAHGGGNATEQAKRRRDAVHRLLVEQARPMRLAEVQADLRLTKFETQSALRRLVKEGRVMRTGTRTSTRYEVRSDGAPTSAALSSVRSGGEGTLRGRFLETIEDRGSASVEELAQAFRMSREDVERECGALVREEEIRMASRNGTPVYIGQVAA